MQRGCAGPRQICILPHVWTSDLRDLCGGLPVPKRNSHSTTCLGIRHARSPQTVAAGKEDSHVSDTPQGVTFRKPPPGCPCRQREIEKLEKSDFAGV